MDIMRIGPLADDPIAAAAQFYAGWASQFAAARADALLVFAPADHTHRAWRLAAIQGLARQLAPLRINAVASDDAAAIAAAADYLGKAEGLTGQLLPLDSAGAGAMLNPAM